MWQLPRRTQWLLLLWQEHRLNAAARGGGRKPAIAATGSLGPYCSSPSTHASSCCTAATCAHQHWRHSCMPIPKATAAIYTCVALSCLPKCNAFLDFNRISRVMSAGT